LLETFGLRASRSTIRRMLKQARMSWKKVKKMLGKANPDKRAAHVEQLKELYKDVCSGEVILVYIDEAHFHRDMDLGYTWGRIGKRIWRKSGCAKLSERLNCYGAYDFSNGECLLWEDGWCDGERTVKFLRELKRWREGKKGRVVVIWDNAPCHTAKVVKAEAARLGIELVYLPGYSPDLNPIGRVGLDAPGGHARPLPPKRRRTDRRRAEVRRLHQPRPHRRRRSPLARLRTRPGVRSKTPGLSVTWV